jgi:hypothetical protein
VYRFVQYFKTKEGDISKGKDLIFGGRSNDRKLNMDVSEIQLLLSEINATTQRLCVAV